MKRLNTLMVFLQSLELLLNLSVLQTQIIEVNKDNKNFNPVKKKFNEQLSLF